MSPLPHNGRRLVSAGFAGLCLLIAVRTAVAQVDTPAAAEARQALRAVRGRYARDPDWNVWAATLNLPDVQHELLAGSVGASDVLQAAVIELRAGRAPEFTEAPFSRLATALEARAQELLPLPQAEWPSACAHAAEDYQPVSVESLEAARLEWQRTLDEFELVLPSVREPDSPWATFLFWPESRQLVSPTTGPLPSGETLDRLETRWASTSSVWGDEKLFEASLAARNYLRTLRGYLAGETREQHAAAWQELGDLILALAAEPANTSAVARAVTQRERLGEVSRLTASIRRELSRPNVLLQIDRRWLESQFEQDVSEAYEVNDVFAGTRSVGNGQLVGTIRAEILPSLAIGRWQLKFEGTSTARTRGTQDGVRVVSRATTRVTATVPFRLDARGLRLERGRADATTNIVYDNIDSPGLAWRRNQAVSETYARRPQAERESAALARRSILEKTNDAAGEVADKFNALYHARLRDPRIAALRPTPQIRVRATEQNVRWECLLEGRETFAAPVAPPALGSDSKVVFQLAASAIEEQAAVALAGRDLSGEQLLQRLGSATDDVQSESTSAFHVTFADDPCDVGYEEGVVRVRLFITNFDSADVNYPAMTVDVSYQPVARDGRLVLVREGRVRVTPLATGEGDAPKISGRQQTLRLAVERKLAKVLTEELEGIDVKLPLSDDEKMVLRVENVRLEGPWLQLGLEPSGGAKL